MSVFRFSSRNKRASIWMDILEIEANEVVYIHTYLHPKISNEFGQAGHVRDLN